MRPSVDRTPKGPWVNTLQSTETELIQSACKKFPLVFDVNEYPVLLLAKLQHYGIPTRMMDVTANALVALYFACQKSKDKQRESDSGVVYSFEAQACSPYNPYVNAIADTYRLTRNAFMGVNCYLYKIKQQDYFKPMLYEVKNTDMELKHFLYMIKDPVFVDAGDFCDRQKNQQGKFVIFPNRITWTPKDQKKTWDDNVPEEECDPNICDDLVDMDDKLISNKIIIPAEIKEVLLSQLKRFGISREYLFADSVDVVCSEITNEISKRFSR